MKYNTLQFHKLIKLCDIFYGDKYQGLDKNFVSIGKYKPYNSDNEIKKIGVYEFCVKNLTEKIWSKVPEKMKTLYAFNWDIDYSNTYFVLQVMLLESKMHIIDFLYDFCKENNLLKSPK